MTDMINDLLEIAGDYASIASDGIEAGDITGHINTGSMPLNALLSGSIYGGVLIPKVTALAGEPSTGKTFYAINILKKFLEADPNGIVVYFETESALDLDMLEQRGINTKRVIVAEVATVQEFRTKAMQMLDFYIEKRKKGDKNPVLFVLDSLGGLSTQKEVEDIASGKDSRDMTRAQLIRGAFRVLTLKLGKAKIALIITNHTYDIVGSYVPMKKMNGGAGLEYAASTIIFLSKKKAKYAKDDTEGYGAIITCTLKKARKTIENKKVETLLNYKTGLDPYFGLLDLSLKFGIVEKMAQGYKFPGEIKAASKALLLTPEKFFTKEVLDLIDEKCKDEFLYGKTNVTLEETSE